VSVTAVVFVSKALPIVLPLPSRSAGHYRRGRTQRTGPSCPSRPRCSWPASPCVRTVWAA